MNTILDQAFFDRFPVEVAHDLVGKYLVSTLKGHSISLLVNEVEAYDGEQDLACHARVGKTTRTMIMFGPGGYFYVYLIYGVYWMLNIVAGPEGHAGGILIRGAGHINGPGRITKYLGITKELYGKAALPENNLWFEDRALVIPEQHILRTPRIGVDYAGPVWSKKLYRFVLKNTFYL